MEDGECAVPTPFASNASTASIESVYAVYRVNGHLSAHLDPLGMTLSSREVAPLPEIAYNRDATGAPLVGRAAANNLSELQAYLANIYCDFSGYEIAHVEEPAERTWLYENIERLGSMQAAPALQRSLARSLLVSEVFDHFMARRFGQVKRYGLEGGEALMAAIEVLLQATNAKHLVFGMAHRGRLNLMVGCLGYPAAAVFHKLTGSSELPSEWPGSADVLSHLSHMQEISVPGGIKKTVTMLPNPSHLEAINPVQQGVVWARQHLIKEDVLAVQIHGDAAFSGQGVAQETLQMANLDGFSIGGTLHIITNNQLGYTAIASMGRSSHYASAPAKIIGAPIIHVNGDAPEQVARAIMLASQYRDRFHKDVLVDIICYRRHGHNELDEPGFTQPLMYRQIGQMSTLPTAYAARLVEEGVITAKEIESIREEAQMGLDKALQEASTTFKPNKFGIQKNPRTVKLATDVETAIGAELLKETLIKSVTLPADFVLLTSRLQKYHIDSRLQMLKEERLDWATAEAVALGSLLKEGFNVRLTGQDVQRGTFSQRHFVFTDQATGQPYTPLADHGSGALYVVNSHLSELAVIGFEYGVSVGEFDRTLPIWEAQFGDFFNGAQVILDTFVSGGQTKWGLSSALTLLLPHGYDGTGPEHSSCRLERFLQMTNAPHDARCPFEPNWRVVHPTTPANYFHLLRRQMHDTNRKPLIVVAPKTLLRLPEATSSFVDVTSRGAAFLPLIDDPTIGEGEGRKRASNEVQTIVFCSGKLYYELERERAQRKQTHSMALVRIEELCPLPTAGLETCLRKYHRARRIVWCQEEHRNMGPYDYVAPRLGSIMAPGTSLEYVGREVSATPAAGYGKLHKQELAQIMDLLFCPKSA